MAKGYIVALEDNKNVLKLVVRVAQPCEYAKNTEFVHLKTLTFVIRKLYPNF